MEEIPRRNMSVSKAPRAGHSLGEALPGAPSCILTTLKAMCLTVMLETRTQIYKSQVKQRHIEARENTEFVHGSV